ncbi:MAG: radical SAM protein [Candidatus Stahlbacteria bacterium]|nr:radical SAM protein [Candidatus Stahlbacteria bacterium]
MIESPSIAGMWKRTAELNIPFTVMMELTYQCNLHCRHCYIVNNDERQELTLTEITRIIDEVRDAGTLFIVLTGGEALIRDDFFAIAKYIRDKGLALMLITNGTLIDVVRADAIAELNPFRVGISLYATKPEIHDKITQVQGSFSETISAIKVLKSKKVNVALKCTIIKQNMGEYKELLVLAKSLGVGADFSPFIVPKDNGSKEPIKYRLADEELEAVISDSELNKKSNYGQGSRKESDFICDAGKSICAISPYGDVYPCIQLRVNAGNLQVNSFKEIWNNGEELLGIRDIKFEHLTQCSHCILWSNCARCPGIALLEDGDLFGPSSLACKLAGMMN